MNKWLIRLGALILGLIFCYASLTALVNQGLSIWGALVMFVLIIVAGSALIYAVKE